MKVVQPDILRLVHYGQAVRPRTRQLYIESGSVLGSPKICAYCVNGHDRKQVKPWIDPEIIGLRPGVLTLGCHRSHPTELARDIAGMQTMATAVPLQFFGLFSWYLSALATCSNAGFSGG